jgi:hypothetical protein
MVSEIMEQYAKIAYISCLNFKRLIEVIPRLLKMHRFE